MSPMFYFLAGLTVLGAVAAMSLRNLVHCALCLVVTFAGLAGIYLGMGAQFLGLAQVAVYIGAVAILLVFVLLLTRPADGDDRPEGSPTWRTGVTVGILVLGVIGYAVISVGRMPSRATEAVPVPVAEIGTVLMREYALPLQVIGVVLTVAMIGAAVLAMPEKRPMGGARGRTVMGAGRAAASGAPAGSRGRTVGNRSNSVAERLRGSPEGTSGGNQAA
ncbi:MAG: NADH-quinone oxidoreductase subunit J [Limisphaerales bacterium]